MRRNPRQPDGIAVAGPQIHPDGELVARWEIARMSPQFPHLMQELHSRISDGIHVRLLWAKHEDRVVVDVDDTKTGDRFMVDVGRHERALDVFHHPFACAALRTG